MLGLTFSSKLDCDSYIIFIAKIASKKIEDLICSIKFLYSEVALYLYKFTIQPCMKYCCHDWAVLLVVIVCTPPFCLGKGMGLNLLPNFQKGGD